MISMSMVTHLKSRIPQIIATGNEMTDKAVEITTTNIQTRAAVNTTRYQTGNMRGGWQSSVDSMRPGRAMGIVFNNVHYTIYHEFGFDANGTPVPGLHMLGDAIEEERPHFERRIEQAYA